jgi:hypothetical protein
MSFFWAYQKYPTVAEPATARATMMHLCGAAISKSYHADRYGSALFASIFSGRICAVMGWFLWTVWVLVVESARTVR